ncbi:hypothetical protein B7494_g1810 [Chlorociboria aeruginascens]|nr:hypothetical protein B7494_g1810 [Chlorociboria aeruginascens]
MMFPHKRQKIDIQVEAPVSAFAARKRRLHIKENDDLQNETTAPIVEPLPLSKGTSKSRYQPISTVEINPSGDNVTAQSPKFDEVDGHQTSINESRGELLEGLPERPPIAFSTFKPSKDNVRELENGTLSLKIAPGERLIILGQYEISLQKGQVTLLGSTLKASKITYPVYAPSSHSLPVIRCLETDVDGAVIRIHQSRRGLSELESLSPLFGMLWNQNSGPLNLDYESLFSRENGSTFQILLSSTDGPKKAFLQPIISPPEWNEIMSRISAVPSEKAPIVMLCGPKSSGKSTFTKLLANKLLSAAIANQKNLSSKIRILPGTALLDLDPGQPEISPPGQLSLIHLREPNFGPPFSHPIPRNQSRVIRAHAICTTSPSLDPSLYMACALDLFAHYRNLVSQVPNCPLVINTPGWILGTGLEILVSLISKIRPTEIIYLSQDGPFEVLESLRDAAKSIPLHTIPSQSSEYTTRTAAHLRTMQTMSYFHLDPMSEETAWDGKPLTSIPPWQIKYCGDNAGILGILCYGEQPPPDLLLELVNGSVVAVAVIDDMAAIPGWETANPDTIDESNESDDNLTSDILTNSTELLSFNETALQPHPLSLPLIISTPHEDLPYFNPANVISLNPKYSHTIGFALVRGIDIERKLLHVLTPIAPDIIEEINEAGKSIVLISGKLDTPGWAYIEDFNLKAAGEKEARRKVSVYVDDESSDDGEEGVGDVTSPESAFRSAPWVERLHGSQGKGVGARVWRVRRDLGRTSDGGE